MERRTLLKLGVSCALPLSACGPAVEPQPPKPPTPAPSPSPSQTVQTTPTAVPSGTAEPSAGAPPPPPPEPAKPSFTRVIARVGKNHGHTFEVTMTDVTAGVEKTFPLGKSGGHDHAVTLSPDELKDLIDGKLIRTKSTKGLNHAHRIVIRCAPAVDPPEWVTACSAQFSGQDEHEVIIPVADMSAKSDKVYEVQGLAGHSHQLALTSGDFEKLLKGEGVSIKTSREESDAHLHVVFIQAKASAKT
ncbi:MAG: hypothetical protein IPK82_35450 [Polyangiaceae bacterium]|nr:hypothetical protein [Polyangiaceae bacterium]